MTTSMNVETNGISVSVSSETSDSPISLSASSAPTVVEVEQLEGDKDQGMTFDQLKKLNEVEAGATKNRSDSEMDGKYFHKVSSKENNALSSESDGLYSEPMALWASSEW